MPDHTHGQFDRADRLLQRLRTERTEASGDLTARLMAAEQRHWDGRAATSTATGTSHGRRSTAARTTRTNPIGARRSSGAGTNQPTVRIV